MKYALALLSILSVALVALLWRQKDALILKERGSFYVGGENVARDFVELGSFRAADTVTINQMYVEYMKPVGKQRIPVVLTHGAGLSGACYDTTPDGRTGWFDYFVRNGFPTYVVDQVGRIRPYSTTSARAGRRPKNSRKFRAWGICTRRGSISASGLKRASPIPILNSLSTPFSNCRR